MRLKLKIAGEELFREMILKTPTYAALCAQAEAKLNITAANIEVLADDGSRTAVKTDQDVARLRHKDVLVVTRQKTEARDVKVEATTVMLEDSGPA